MQQVVTLSILKHLSRSREKSEDLCQTMVASVGDNLLTVDGDMSHHGEQPTETENLLATMEYFIVLTWLD